MKISININKHLKIFNLYGVTALLKSMSLDMTQIILLSSQMFKIRFTYGKIRAKHTYRW